MKLNLDKLNKLSNLKLDQKKLALIILFVSIIIYLDFSLMIKLQLKSVNALRPKIIKLKSDIDKFNKDLVMIQELKQKQAKISQKESLKAKKIVSQDAIPSLIEYISNTANQNNLKITQLKPSKELKAQGGPVSKDTAKLSPFLITLDLSAEYHRFGAFLNALENAQDFMAVQELRITRGQKDDFQQNVNLVLRTYVKK